MQLIRKISVLVLFSLLALPSALTAQMGMEDYGDGYGMAVELSPLQEAIEKLWAAKNDPQREKLVAKIRDELGNEYDAYLKQNQAQINQLQKRLDALKKQLKTRVGAKDELVKLELTRIVNESKGLSWPADQSRGGYMGRGSNPADRSGMEDMGMDAGFEDSAAANIVDAEKDLREIAIACFNFESANMRFPKNIDHDNDAKTNPTLSWRVEILPALGEQDLYNKFHLDEPWDSEHNLSLISEMPDVFKSDIAENKSKTIYLGFGSKDAMFENGVEVRFGAISDGSSNTILCVEAAEDKAVVWTKPQDLDWNEDMKLEDLFRFNGQAIGVEGKPKYSFVVRCDGATGFIRSDADRKNIEHAITINDGQRFEHGDVFLPTGDRK